MKSPTSSISPTSSPRLGYHGNRPRTRMQSIQRWFYRLYKMQGQQLATLKRTFNRQPLATKVIAIAILLAMIAAVIVGIAGATVTWYYWSILWERPVQPIPVDGSTSQFTLILMSHPARLRTLKTVIKHYSRCPSVAEILIVWSNGPAPNVETEFESLVPVRLREETINSINNRFKPDPSIATRAVMQLDDDMLMWCSDVERGFAEWRRHPHALVGYFPRRITVQNATSKVFNAIQNGSSSVVVDYLGEQEVFSQNTFNTIITVAEFLDKRAMEWYWADDMAKARAIVDDLFNCEDILMNFVVASQLAANREKRRRGGAEPLQPLQAVRYVRPRRRLDISQLTKYGISRGAAHMIKRRQCSADFVRMFGANTLTDVSIDWKEQAAGRPICGWLPGVGCMYF